MLECRWLLCSVVVSHAVARRSRSLDSALAQRMGRIPFGQACILMMQAEHIRVWDSSCTIETLESVLGAAFLRHDTEREKYCSGDQQHWRLIHLPTVHLPLLLCIFSLRSAFAHYF